MFQGVGLDIPYVLRRTLCN